MNTYVHFNDIFNITTPTVMEQRINQAFGTDGTNFWQNFFFCDEVHKNDKIIYLFTEYQLEFLWKWWDKKYRTSKNIQKNLECSIQRLSGSVPAGEDLKEIRACYIRQTSGYLELWRVLFKEKEEDVHPNDEEIGAFIPGGLRKVNFFQEMFRGEPPDPKIKLDEGKFRKKILDLLNTRKIIADEFGGPIQEKNIRGVIIKHKKWLRYLAPKHFFKKPLPFEFGYCADIKP